MYLIIGFRNPGIICKHIDKAKLLILSALSLLVKKEKNRRSRIEHWGTPNSEYTTIGIRFGLRGKIVCFRKIKYDSSPSDWKLTKNLHSHLCYLVGWSGSLGKMFLTSLENRKPTFHYCQWLQSSHHTMKLELIDKIDTFENTARHLYI